jgi:hypothetical protein
MDHCPACGIFIATCVESGDQHRYNCRRCGKFTLSGFNRRIAENNLVEAIASSNGRRTNHRRSRLSHIVRRQQNGGGYVGVDPEKVIDWRLDDPLPSAPEQVDNLVLWLGHRQSSPLEVVVLVADEMAAWIGAPIVNNPTRAGLDWIFDQPEVRELVQFDLNMHDLGLTLPGWRRHQDLQSGHSQSRVAFMALQFGDAELDKVVDVCFRGAVARTGYALRRATDEQRAGLIDDQMRVSIRTARFVLADLTHANNGAYWEAGFAEGLGKPVIYTCSESAWKERPTHFDTNHMLTIKWNTNDLGRAGEELVNRIRTTLPDEAKMTDN